MTEFRLDPANDVHARALARLESEQIGWLGSNGRNGYPHAVPVWFLWHEERVLVFSAPGAAKTKNLRADARAMFHLEAGDDGEQLHVLQGVAELSDDPSSVWFERVGDAFFGKYRAGYERLGWSREYMAENYSVAIVFRPEKLIAW